MRILRRLSVFRVHIFLMGCLAVFLTFFHTPRQAPLNPFVRIAEGDSFAQIATQLHADGVIASPTLFRVVAMVARGTTALQAGTYRFEEPEHLLGVVRRLTLGEYGIEPVRVVFLEGSTAYEMSKKLVDVLGAEETKRFVEIAQPYDGYLFPDTYAFMPDTSARDVVRTLRKTFEERTAELHARADAEGRDWNQIVTMASIIEEEVRTYEERRLVSGILWNRIEEDMALQVDASFSYLFGKASDEVTLDDIATDSPYNTYKYKGLPPTPITNPGLTAIEAALDPAETNYFFYLSGRDGTTHYARTYQEHLHNKAMYID